MFVIALVASGDDVSTFFAGFKTTPFFPSSMPSILAALMKYCMVVPVLLVWTAFNSSSLSVNVLGTNLQWEK